MSGIVITPLGTVSPYLKGDRNCPGFLIEYKDVKILLDCGNGITRLLHFPTDLKNLHVIITHYHKDHFGDIGALQYASYVYHNLGLLKDKIKIFLPKNDFGFNRKSIVANKETYSRYIDINDGSRFTVGDLEIIFEDNNSHSIESYMIKLKIQEFVIVYTSDVGTTNFNKMIEFCKNADLIICESSFLKKHNSQSLTHMTAYDAGVLASCSCTKRLLLTHFWPEEDRQLYLKEAKQSFENTEIAEEGKKLILRREA